MYFANTSSKATCIDPSLQYADARPLLKLLQFDQVGEQGFIFVLWFCLMAMSDV